MIFYDIADSHDNYIYEQTIIGPLYSISSVLCVKTTTLMQMVKLAKLLNHKADKFSLFFLRALV